jgi:hypothetical protein
MEFGRIIFRKNGNWRIFFGKNHGKLAHLRNLAPKIIYERHGSKRSRFIGCRGQRHGSRGSMSDMISVLHQSVADAKDRGMVLGGADLSDAEDRGMVPGGA